MDSRINPHSNSLCSVCWHPHSADINCGQAHELRRAYYETLLSVRASALRDDVRAAPTALVLQAAGYECLSGVLDRAYNQAATGKGAERHADNRPFDDQPMQHIARRRGVGFILGQADKKSEEAQGMLSRGEREKAVHELLGAIVYLAGAVIYIEKEHQQ